MKSAGSSSAIFLWIFQMSCDIFFAMAKGAILSADKSEVLQGTLDMMILKTLHALGPLHGFGIARRIEQVSQVLLDHQAGTNTTRGRNGKLGANLWSDRSCFAFRSGEIAMTTWIFRLVSRVRGLFGQKQADSEFDLETQMHLQLLTERFAQQGMNPKDAY